MYFTADDGGPGHDLWVTDGTTAGTREVGKINTMARSYPMDLTVVGDLLYFNADNTTHGYELWVSAAGTATITGTLNTTLITDTATLTFTSSPTPAPTEPEPEPDAPDDPEVPDFEFDDVSTDSVHAEAVYRMRQYSITVGTSDTSFDPSGGLPRSQMCRRSSCGC